MERAVSKDRRQRHPHAVALGMRVAQARKALRYGPFFLAHKAGVDIRCLRKIENGITLAQHLTIQKLAGALEVDIDWLEVGVGRGPKV